MNGRSAEGRWRALAWLAVAEFLAMSTWFSGSAVAGDLQSLWGLTTTATSFLTIAVQLGFVAGALVSAALSVADRVSPRLVVAAGALGAAVANAGLLVAGNGVVAMGLRFLTGCALALVYPPALKAMATWFRAGRGFALGVMVGALTLGSALPHLFRGLGGLDWRTVVVATSLSTVLGGGLALIGRDGPHPFPRAPFDPRMAITVFRQREVRLASLGYFGHMWELYAMWAWIGAYLMASFEQAGTSEAGTAAAFGAFGAVGIGALGCVLGGVLADRYGRAWLAGVALVASGTSAGLAGAVWGRSSSLVLAVALFWGFWVVADSAQFSTLVTEFADQRYVATALTMQLAIGFTLTVATIWVVPLLVQAAGWRWAFLVLTPGPICGIWAMRRLDPSTSFRRNRLAL